MKRIRRNQRRGAAVVEFAIVAPLFMAMLMGVLETSRMMETENLLSVAAREGGRLGAMDREGLMTAGQTSNQKVIADVLGFLESSGLPADEVDVFLSEVDEIETEFDLDDPDNKLRLFQVTVQISYDEVGYVSFPGSDEFSIEGKVVFRNSRATIAN